MRPCSSTPVFVVTHAARSPWERPGGTTFLSAGLVDGFHLALAPIFFGGGRRLFDADDLHTMRVTPLEVVRSPRVTHLRYAVTRAA